MRGIRFDSAKVLAARAQLAEVSLYEEQIRRFEEISQSKQGDLGKIHNLFLDTEISPETLRFL